MYLLNLSGQQSDASHILKNKNDFEETLISRLGQDIVSK